MVSADSRRRLVASSCGRLKPISGASSPGRGNRRFMTRPLIVRRGQRALDAGPPEFDGAADVLQEERLSAHQFFDMLAVDLQNGHLVECVRGRGRGLPGERGAAKEVTLLEGTHRDDGA